MNRRIKTAPHHLHCRHLTGYLGLFSSDIFKANIKSLRGNEYIQLFCNRGKFAKYYPIKEKSDAHHSLDSFIHDIGIPEEMLTGNVVESYLDKLAKTCYTRKICQLATESHSPWKNH